MVDKRTLDEVTADDVDEMVHKIKNANRHSFLNEKKAMKFQGACVQMALHRVGVIITRNINPRIVDKQMADNHVKVEHRTKVQYLKEEDAWRRGLYIYKNNEIAYFVSDVIEGKPSPFARDHKKYWRVITNVSMEEDRRITSFMGRPASGVKGNRGNLINA